VAEKLWLKNILIWLLISIAAPLPSVLNFCTPLTAQQIINVSDPAYKLKVLTAIDSLLNAKYVLPDRAEEYARAFKKGYEQGLYDSVTNSKEFARMVTADLIALTCDRHFNFRVIESSDMGEKPEGSLHHPIRYHRLGIRENAGFTKLEWFEGNIGYLDIRRFNTFADVKERVVAAMRFLANARAIIIDLRENGGGSGDYLSSYFLKYPTPLTGWYSREDDFLTEFSTIRDIGMEPLTEVPLFLLTSQRTFSAAESFAYDMQVQKRAVIIGDSTRGGAHSVDLYKIDEQFEIYIPTARAIHPQTGGNWEGTGVIPDRVVPAAAALDTALVLARKAGEEFGNAKDVKLRQAVAEMQVQLDRAEILYRDLNIKKAGIVLDSVFQTVATFHLINEFFMDVLAYNYQSAEDEQMLYAILQKKIEYFPGSYTAYETLAYAYYKNNKKEQAIANFKKVLELDPDNRNAVKMIERMQNQ
jgi:tetratricopeptide (TPR) repeat protein